METVTREKVQEEEYDFFERAIRKTGCWEAHLACAECMADTKDWRECQNELRVFKLCMQNYTKQKKEAAEKEASK